MHLNEAQLRIGWEAAAEYYSPVYEDLSAAEKYALQELMSMWLAPCLIVLPDTASSEAIDEGCYSDEFLSAGRALILKKYRRKEIYSAYSDCELLRRIDPEELAQAINDLTFLTSAALDAMERFQSGLNNERQNLGGVSIETLLANIHSIDIDRALEEIGEGA